MAEYENVVAAEKRARAMAETDEEGYILTGGKYLRQMAVDRINVVEGDFFRGFLRHGGMAVNSVYFHADDVECIEASRDAWTKIVLKPG